MSSRRMGYGGVVVSGGCENAGLRQPNGIRVLTIIGVTMREARHEANEQ